MWCGSMWPMGHMLPHHIFQTILISCRTAAIRREKGVELSLESALLVPFYDEALQNQEDDHQGQDADGGTDKEFVQIEHLGIQEVGKHHLNRPCRSVLTNYQRPQES